MDNEKVSFFVVGVQKAGTTALDYMLRQHPQVRLPSAKEPHFFDNDSHDWRAPPYERLHRAFGPPGKGSLRGEMTPIYSYWPDSLERIARYNPEAKIVLCLRHPVHRAFSQWRMETARGHENLPFEEAVSVRGRRRVVTAPKGVHRQWSYIERGFYGDQIARIVEIFGRDKMHILKTQDLWQSPQATLDSLCAFLELPTFEAPARRYVTPYTPKPGPDLNPAFAADLMPMFTAQIQKASELAEICLSDWTSPGYREPEDQHARYGSSLPPAS